MASPLGLAGPFAFNTTLSIRPLLIGPRLVTFVQWVFTDPLLCDRYERLRLVMPLGAGEGWADRNSGTGKRS